jgi:hypothetical protein
MITAPVEHSDEDVAVREASGQREKTGLPTPIPASGPAFFPALPAY